MAQGPVPGIYHVLDWVLPLVSLAAIGAALALGLSSPGWGYYLSVGYLALWGFLVLRLYLHIAWLGGLPTFCYLSKRFPVAWANTIVLFPLMFTCKLVQFLVCEMLLLEFVGQVYKCKGENLTLERYGRMVKDLEKTRIFRAEHGYMNSTIYPFMLSTQIACNVYSLGPYTGFGLLTVLFDKNHVTFRNGLFGTHMAYNYHVTVFFDNEKGECHWHTAHALLPGFELVYRHLWEFYSEHMFELIEESEQRAGTSVVAPSTDMEANWPPTTSSHVCRAHRTERTHVITANLPRGPLEQELVS